MERILAFDTSTEHLGIALYTNGEATAIEETTGSLRHTEHLLPAIRSLLNRSGVGFDELSAVACARGPGSFTGLRVGLSTAKAITVARGIPLMTVPTLIGLFQSWQIAVKPQRTPLSEVVLAVLDARKRRFYGQLFRTGPQNDGTTAATSAPAEYQALTEPLDRTAADLVLSAIAAAADHPNKNVRIRIVGAASVAFRERLHGESRELSDSGLEFDEKPISGVRGVAQIAAERRRSGDWDPPGQGLLYIRGGDIGGRRSTGTFTPGDESQPSI